MGCKRPLARRARRSRSWPRCRRSSRPSASTAWCGPARPVSGSWRSGCPPTQRRSCWATCGSAPGTLCSCAASAPRASAATLDHPFRRRRSPRGLSRCARRFARVWPRAACWRSIRRCRTTCWSTTTARARASCPTQTARRTSQPPPSSPSAAPRSLNFGGTTHTWWVASRLRWRCWSPRGASWSSPRRPTAPTSTASPTDAMTRSPLLPTGARAAGPGGPLRRGPRGSWSRLRPRRPLPRPTATALVALCQSPAACDGRSAGRSPSAAWSLLRTSFRRKTLGLWPERARLRTRTPRRPL
mmetsp:Transcript_75399/g.202409  ORF Transcript_75399/g.202409 Transcript_75399/m.202409 type:complete len:300 (+) Transcript_75399:66-965(+)